MIDVVDYLPDPDLDAELAELGYAAVHGWPDQRPVTPALVRSHLRPTGTTATTLALHHQGGRLLAAAALRWPATLDATGRLWGPVVHPSARRGGLGAALLSTVADIVAAHPGIRVTTDGIPETRSCGWSLYERAGWRGCGSSRLLRRALTNYAAVAFDAAPPTLAVRMIQPGEYLDQCLAALASGARPDLGYATARDTYTRWTADERYTPNGLLLAKGPAGVLGAALVYPLTHYGPGEPPEALLADLLTASHLDPAIAAEVRTALVDAALRAGVAMGAAVARTVVDDPGLTATLLAAGFEVADHIRYYAPRGVEAVPAVAGTASTRDNLSVAAA